MVNGNILLDEDGLDIQKIKDSEKRSAVGNFCKMIEEAHIEGDTLYYIYESPCNIYSILYDPEKPYCKLIGQKLFNELQNVFGNFPHAINSLEEFETTSEPRTHGGFKYENSPLSDYVYDKFTIDKWHNQWFWDNPDKIDWSKYNNAIWPRYDLTIKILSQELSEIIEAPSNGNDVANLFHEHVMKPLNERDLISKSQIIGGKICEANYYHRVKELEKLETDHGNKDATRIYSIKKDSKYQFLSIDTQHGMLELHNDKGDHQMEIRFDGTKNKDGEVDHSLQCVKEWKQKYNKK